MATKIPPHNLKETVDAVIAYIDDNTIDIDGLMEHLPAPDFPTGGIIYGYAGVREAYQTGRGRIVMRARMHEEEIRPGGMRSSLRKSPTRSTRVRCSKKSPITSRKSASRASATCATNPTGTACAL